MKAKFLKKTEETVITLSMKERLLLIRYLNNTIAPEEAVEQFGLDLYDLIRIK